MQCPLCRESVADDNALQVHYLMSCLGYLKNPSTKKEDTSVAALPVKKLVQFRWVKSKPTLAREVYLISSLASSIKLEWRGIEECFLSDQVEVPQGLHVCQFIVDGDSMSTDDFEISDTSRIVDVLISAAPPADESTGDRSEEQNQEPQVQPTPLYDQGQTQDGRSEVTTQQMPAKGSLYHDLIKHQILHGDSLETLTDGPAGEPGESSGQRRRRGNGAWVDQRNKQGTASRESDSGHQTTRTNPNTSDLPSERQSNDALRDSLNSDDLQQFLQPTRTRQENNGVSGNIDLGTSEDRESSISDNEELSASVSLSSRDDLERRPELLGQSNGENEPRVQPDIPVDDISQEDGDDVADKTPYREEPVSAHGQETLLVDLREPSSGTDRKGSSGDNRGEVGSGRGRTCDDHRDDKSEMRRQPALVNEREGTSGDHGKKSSVKDRRSSDDTLDKSSSDAHTQPRCEPARGNGEPKPLEENILESSGNGREPATNHRELSDGNRQRPGHNRSQPNTLETKPSTSHHHERPSGLEDEKSIDGHEPNLHEHQEKTRVVRRMGASLGNTSGYLSLPTTLSPRLKTQNTQPEVSQRGTEQSGPLSEDLFSSQRLGTRTSATGSRGSRDDAAKTTTDDLLFRSYSASNISAFTRETIAAGADRGALSKESAPGRNIGGRSRDISTPGSEEGAHNRDISAPTREISIRGKDASAASGETNARNRDISGTSERGTGAPRADMSSLRRGANPSSDENRYQLSTSRLSGTAYEPALTTRRSPAGSFADDSDIRRPPLYTSAPSRPYSSLAYTGHAAVSPLSSPRDDEMVVSNASRTSASALSHQTRTTAATTQSLLGRGDPMGSAVSPERAQAAVGGNSTSAKQFSDDKVKELLENLKQQHSSRRNISPETSPRDSRETTSFKLKLAERDDLIKKLKAKNSSYKQKIEELREKEIELTKALSLTEGNQKALKDQEEISRELTDALGDKEKQYAELELLFMDMKRTQRHMTGEFEKEKNDYERKILDLRKIYSSLEEEVKTLRELPRRTSPKSSSEYKALLERWEESFAISASLKDQVKTMERENKDLKEKLSIFLTGSGNRTSYRRVTDSTQTGRSLETSREDHSILNGYPATSESPTLVAREQFRHTDERLPNSTRDVTSTSRYHRDGYRPALENSRYQSDHRTNRSQTQAETIRTRFDIQPEKYRSEVEGSQERSESRREPSSEYRSGRSETSPVAERHQSRDSRSRRRVTTADDAVTGHDYRHVLPRRSHSSDAVRNAVLDGARSRISPSQERGSQELDKRSKDRSRLYHAGSYEHLDSSYTTSAQRSDLALTGHRVDYSPTSPDSTSPPTGRRSTTFAPDSPQQIDIGMTVLATRHRGMSRGIVRYVGTLPDKGHKVYVGIELFDRDGKHDGKFNGRRFFNCKPGHGVFVPFEKVVVAYT